MQYLSRQIRLLKYSIRFGYRKAVTATILAEVLIFIPGCELSAQLRKDMVKSFFGAGGRVTFESLLSNPRIQERIRGLKALSRRVSFSQKLTGAHAAAVILHLSV